MARKLKAGDEVAWNTSQGPTRGRVVKKVERPAKIKDFEVAASKSDPRYVVESKSGKRAAHKAEALRPVKKAAKKNTRAKTR